MNLADLNLANNRLSTAFGWGIETLTHLRRLDLHGNRITDPLEVCCVMRWAHTVASTHPVPLATCTGAWSVPRWPAAVGGGCTAGQPVHGAGL